MGGLSGLLMVMMHRQLIECFNVWLFLAWFPFSREYQQRDMKLLDLIIIEIIKVEQKQYPENDIITFPMDTNHTYIIQ